MVGDSELSRRVNSSYHKEVCIEQCGGQCCKGYCGDVIETTEIVLHAEKNQEKMERLVKRLAEITLKISGLDYKKARADVERSLKGNSGSLYSYVLSLESALKEKEGRKTFDLNNRCIF